MRVYEFADAMRYTNLKDRVIIKRGEEHIRGGRIEDLPHRTSDSRHPKFKFYDEHIETIHMEAVWHEGALAPDYVITINLRENGED